MLRVAIMQRNTFATPAPGVAFVARCIYATQHFCNTAPWLTNLGSKTNAPNLSNPTFMRFIILEKIKAETPLAHLFNAYMKGL